MISKSMVGVCCSAFLLRSSVCVSAIEAGEEVDVVLEELSADCFCVVLTARRGDTPILAEWGCVRLLYVFCPCWVHKIVSDESQTYFLCGIIHAYVRTRILDKECKDRLFS